MAALRKAGALGPEGESDVSLLTMADVDTANDAMFESAAAAGIIKSAKPDMSAPVDPAIFHTGGGPGLAPFLSHRNRGAAGRRGGRGGRAPAGFKMKSAEA